ncbi:hypothetical protein TIFTF001_003215 [Ficus carica]|uniref:Uncharacterized protein n=1 Tax=Ficus carica TaxID=3494 RepID=A0AA87ZEU1_FICCA|nr:hypothetical protein TIFTF001_003215 [Ficus carica]
MGKNWGYRSDCILGDVYSGGSPPLELLPEVMVYWRVSSLAISCAPPSVGSLEVERVSSLGHECALDVVSSRSGKHSLQWDLNLVKVEFLDNRHLGKVIGWLFSYIRRTFLGTPHLEDIFSMGCFAKMVNG